MRKSAEELLLEWHGLINDRTALIADPDARRDFLESFVTNCQGVIDQEELVEMYELIDCARWWAIDERVTLGIGE
ncbi:hypothetical protein ACCD10_17675 [Pseudomonas sp. Pseusp122]|uniref:hypothetical protein n=1 Tax=unclassified Pseudomonas TaxID=196821 RepID=UPI0039A63FB4